MACALLLVSGSQPVQSVWDHIANNADPIAGTGTQFQNGFTCSLTLNTNQATKAVFVRDTL